MARFNEILVGRYARFAQKLFSMKGGVGIPTLSPDLVIDLPLNNGAENRYLEGWDQFGLNQGVAGVAAQTGQMKLRNPLGSNVIIVITRAEFQNQNVADAPSSYYASLDTVDYSGVATTVQVLDVRGRTHSTGIISSQAQAANPPGVKIAQGASGTTIVWYAVQPDVNDEINLLPGSSFSMSGGVPNNQVFFNFRWRERYLEESERA